ncbi:MAG: hypothetical protein A2355_09190 [Spirochaetes bacterium RIFOXYB1_FULL_32_8]|nr:MAG: hypothetical protein A2355_09190 [Spirochaetes bacterium RIFOXYB1_FULL_32_8]
MYKEEEKKHDKLMVENNSLQMSKNDIEINIHEMHKKVNEEIGKRDDINKRINSLNDGKDKIKIARQVKSWEKEMERQQQELSLIQAQIDYDSSKQSEMKVELDKIVVKLDDNNKKVNDLVNQINVIKEKYKDELKDIDKDKIKIRDEFDIQFVEYFEALLIKTCGSAIVEIDDEACLGCYTILPTMLQGELGPDLTIKNIELYQCPHCFRYLYYKQWLKLI